MTVVGTFSTLAAIVLAYVIYKISTKRDPYHDIPVMPRESLILGNEGDRDNGDLQAGTKIVKCARNLNSDVFLLPEPLGATVLLVGDPVLLNFVLNDVRKFPSTEMRSAFVKFMIGDGIASAQSHEHAKQRRIMGPAFTLAHVRQMTPVFTSKAEELSAKITQIVKDGGQAKWNTKGYTGIVNVTEFLDAASFDIIGKAGFGVDFGCIKNGQENVELARGYNRLLQAAVKFSAPRVILLIAAGLFNPDWVGLPLNEVNHTIIAQNKQLDVFTAKVIEEKIKRITVELDEGVEKEDKEEVEDLVEVVVRTNLEMQRQGKSGILTAKELQGQIQTLLFAGYETSSATASLCLHYLSHNQSVQDRLRKEIKEHIEEVNATSGDSGRTQLTTEELQSPKLHLLSNCLRETLRLAPAVTISQRSVTEDCVAPVARPIPTRDGKSSKSQIVLRKGTRIGCCFKVAAMNAAYWGPNPDDWNPDRFDNLPEEYKKASMPGPAGIPTFSAGPASCLGARFALLEMTALIVALISNHKFEPSSYQIIPKQVLVLRPTVVGQEAVALPLKVTNLS